MLVYQRVILFYLCPGLPAAGHGRRRAGRRAAAPQGAHPTRRARVAARGAVRVKIGAQKAEKTGENRGKSPRNWWNIMEI